MSFRRAREQRFPRTGEVSTTEVSTNDVWTNDVWPEDADPSVFFGEDVRSRKGNRKAMQLCKQVERAVAVTLASVPDCDSLLGASVASVEPAPDAGRLRAIVVLAPEHETADAVEARAALVRWAPEFRAEVGAAIHRKRVPEIVFDVRLAGEVGGG